MDEDKELLALGAEAHDNELESLGAEPYVPSPEEQAKVAAYMMKPQPSMGESALAGAEQGLTFGFADEMGGALGAGLEGTAEAIKQKSLRPLGDQNLMNLYAEYRDMNRKKYDEAAAANPGSFGVGNVAGGALLPVGAFGQVGKLGKAADLGQKVRAGTALGMGTGGIAAAGTTDAPLMSGEFAQDVAGGIGMGTVLGGGLPLVGAAAKGTFGYGKSLASPVIKGFKQGIRGVNLLDDEAEKGIQGQIANYGRDLSADIKVQLDDLGRQKNELIREAQESGMQVDPQKIDEFMNSRLGQDVDTNLPEVKREIEQFREMLRTAQQGPMVDKSNRVFYGADKTQKGKFEDLFVQKQAEQILAPGSTNPEPLEVIFEATDVPNKTIGVIRQKMYDDMGNFSGWRKVASKLMDSDEAAKFKDVTEQVRAGGKDLRDPKQLYQLYKDLKQKSGFGDYSFKSQEAQKMAGESMKDVQGMLRGTVPGLANTDAKIASLKQGANVLGMEDTVQVDTQGMMNKVIDLINNQEKTGPAGSKAREQLQMFVNSIRAEHPGLAKSVESKIKDLGEQAIMSKAVGGIVEPGIVSTAKRGAAAVGNIAGYGVHKLTKLPPEAWVQKSQEILSKAGNSPAAQQLAKIVGTLPDKPERERNAILFGLMQNPAYRQWLNPPPETPIPGEEPIQ